MYVNICLKVKINKHLYLKMFIMYYTMPEIKMKSLFQKCFVNEVFSKTQGSKLIEES
jgi:hypothetical protein